MSRNEKHLNEYKEELTKMGIKAYTKVADDLNTEMITKVFQELKVEVGTSDLLFYNAGITQLDSEIKGNKDFNLLVERYKIDVAGAYHAIQQVLGEEFSKKNGTILITGGGLAMYPMDVFLPLSMDKAALRAMCIALHEELKKQNVFLGTVTVTGTIEPDTNYDPKILAEEFYKLYTERTNCEIIH